MGGWEREGAFIPAPLIATRSRSSRRRRRPSMERPTRLSESQTFAASFDVVSRPELARVCVFFFLRR